MFEDFTLVNDQTLNIINNFNDYIEKQINKPLPFSLKKTELIAEPSSGEKTTKYLLQMFPKKILESKKSTFSSWKKSINCSMNPKEKKKLSEIRRTVLNRGYAKKYRSFHKSLLKNMQTNPNTENNYKCKICNYVSTNKIFSQVHSQLHNNSGKFECLKCVKIYNRSFNLIRHLKHAHPEIFK